MFEKENMKAMALVTHLLIITSIGVTTTASKMPGGGKIFFPDDTEKTNRSNSSTDQGNVKPRFGFNNNDGVHFGVEPSSNGGVTASGSFSNSYGNQGQGQGNSGSQSHSFNFNLGNNGFSGSQSSSQASSFNAQFPGFYGGGSPQLSGSQASSQSSGFSASTAGISGSQAGSQTSGFTSNFGNTGHQFGNSGGSTTAVGSTSSSQSGSQGAGFSNTLFGARNPGYPNFLFGSGYSRPHNLEFGANPGFNRRPGNWQNIPQEFLRSNQPGLFRKGQNQPEYSVFSGIVVNEQPKRH